jgi:hypothetical protein
VVPELKKAADHLISAAFRCRQRSSVVLLMKLLGVLLRVDSAFAEVFSERIKGHAKAFAHSYASARVTAILMICTVLEFDNAVALTSLKELIFTQCVILEVCLADNKRFHGTLEKAIVRLWRKRSDLFEFYFEALCATVNDDGMRKFYLTHIFLAVFVIVTIYKTNFEAVAFLGRFIRKSAQKSFDMLCILGTRVKISPESDRIECFFSIATKLDI